ncbi:MAG: polymorphic toxin-type HINT domain-containing protein [Caldilineaceae bacterium]
MYYYNARYYDPEIGQFISPDTVVPDPTNLFAYNRYMYSFGNPLKYNDPSGHDPQCDVGTSECDAEWALWWQYLSVQAQWPSWEEFRLGYNYYSQYAANPELLLSDFHLVNEYDTAAQYRTTLAMAYASFVKNTSLNTVLTSQGANPLWAMLSQARDGGNAALLFDTAMAAAAPLGAYDEFLSDGPCSFSAETPVTTSDGSTPIATIEVGDQVLAYDEGLQQTGYYTVTAVMAHEDPLVVWVTINGETLSITPDHPFYAMASAPWLALGETMGRWQAAGYLVVGDHIRRANGQTGVVQAVQVVQEPQMMYNLTVAEVHTFFVGEQGWLVHNQCARVLQTGGHTLSNRTIKELGLTKGEAKRAIEALKADLGERNDFHPKIWSNGDVTHPQTGEVLGNLFDYVD